MNKNDIVGYLRDVLRGEPVEPPNFEAIDDGIEGCLIIEAGGKRYSLEVRHAGPSQLDFLPSKVRDDETVQEQRSRLAQMIEEGQESVEKYGPVPAEEVARRLDAAMARGGHPPTIRIQQKSEVRRAK